MNFWGLVVLLLGAMLIAMVANNSYGAVWKYLTGGAASPGRVALK